MYINWNKIGFGTWPLSGNFNGSISYGKVNDEDSKRALLFAFNSGINVYDTSNFYGFGHVEDLIGTTFKGVRDKIVIITKGGFVSKDKQDFSPNYLFKSFCQSLSRLRTDYIDVYMLHSPSLSILKDGKVIELLKKIKSDNLIKEYGISLISPNDGIEAINNYDFKAVEINYNILDHRAENNGLLSLCKERGIKTIIRTPLAQGILTGKFIFNNDKADVRQKWKIESVNKQTEIYKKMLYALSPNDYTDAQNCLRFCLSNPNVSVIIPGMKTENEVLENIKSLNFPLFTETELNSIKNIYKLNYES